VREARFIKNVDGSADGGVHALFTITGRGDAGGCVLAQPDFAQELASNNISFRIPTPLFGSGLIEQIPDSAILANQTVNAAPKRHLGLAAGPTLPATATRWVVDFILGTHPISRKGTTEIGGAKRRSAFVYLHSFPSFSNLIFSL
jgi:hypothetical protein